VGVLQEHQNRHDEREDREYDLQISLLRDERKKRQLPL
jgi:hypothetical protein